MFSLARGIHEKEEKIQVATFLHVAGVAAQKVFETLEFAVAADRQKIKPVLDSFTAYCEPKKNITVARYMFNSRQQKLNENFTDYVTVLRTLIRDCELPNDLADEFLRDRIVCGIRDGRVRERLLRVDNLTLKKATDACKIAELNADQLKALALGQTGQQDSLTTSSTVNAVGRSTATRSKPKRECPNCPYDHDYGKCPAKGKTCAKCKKPNHFAAKCRGAESAAEESQTQFRANRHRGRGVAAEEPMLSKRLRRRMTSRNSNSLK
jgi:hypothetical protein